MPNKRGLIIVSSIVILMITMPYLFAFQQNDGGYKFGGFLINPVDGHSYLAKMEIGKRGNWIFDLPYTADEGEGAYLFLFYIILGHAARILGAESLYIYHLARIISAVCLILCVNQFFKSIFKEYLESFMALTLSMLGSGLGWIAILAGMFTSDLWVAEAFPFLSAYTNPHFTLGLAIVVWTLTPGFKPGFLISLLTGLLLAVIQPFAVVIVILVMGGCGLVEFISGKGRVKDRLISLSMLWITIGFGLGGGIYLLYQYAAILSDPLLAQWNAQNVTPSPGLPDLLISFSPCLILAAAGINRAWKSKNAKVLVIWSLLSLALLAIPWNLQRRFITGLFLPLAGLSIFGLKELADKQLLKLKSGFVILMVLSIPTNLIVISSGILAAGDQDPAIFLSKHQLEILDWINVYSKPDALVLADADLSLYIPSMTGRRVVYGHPFETVKADLELAYLDEFLGLDHIPNYYRVEAKKRGIDLIVQSDDFGRGFSEWVESDGIEIIFSTEELTVFEVKQ